MVPQTVVLWDDRVFLKLILRLETKPVANRQFMHLSSLLAASSELIPVDSYFVLVQNLLC